VLRISRIVRYRVPVTLGLLVLLGVHKDLSELRFLFDHLASRTPGIIKPLYGTPFVSESLRGRHFWQAKATKVSFDAAIPTDFRFDPRPPASSGSILLPKELLQVAAFTVGANTRAPPNPLQQTHVI
jgi:hypothetical protein